MQPTIKLTISENPECTCAQMMFPQNNRTFNIDQMGTALENVSPKELLAFAQMWSKTADESALPLVISHDVVCQLAYAAYWAGLTPHLKISYPTGVADAFIPLAIIRFDGQAAPEPLVIERLANEAGGLNTIALKQRIQEFLQLTAGDVEVPGMTFTLDSFLCPNLPDELNEQVMNAVWERGNVKII